MSKKESMNQDPPLCAGGCGFFGNPATQNRCSLCHLKQTCLLPPQESSKDVAVGHEIKETDVADHSKKVMNKCNTCKKRVGLTGFECRCGQLFCSSHRHPDSHCCAFDHKGFGRLGLSKALFRIAECKADKLKHRI